MVKAQQPIFVQFTLFPLRQFSFCGHSVAILHYTRTDCGVAVTPLAIGKDHGHILIESAQHSLFSLYQVITFLNAGLSSYYLLAWQDFVKPLSVKSLHKQYPRWIEVIHGYYSAIYDNDCYSQTPRVPSINNYAWKMGQGFIKSIIHSPNRLTKWNRNSNLRLLLLIFNLSKFVLSALRLLDT